MQTLTQRILPLTAGFGQYAAWVEAAEYKVSHGIIGFMTYISGAYHLVFFHSGLNFVGLSGSNSNPPRAATTQRNYQSTK